MTCLSFVVSVRYLLVYCWLCKMNYPNSNMNSQLSRLRSQRKMPQIFTMVLLGRIRNREGSKLSSLLVNDWQHIVCWRLDSNFCKTNLNAYTSLSFNTPTFAPALRLRRKTSTASQIGSSIIRMLFSLSKPSISHILAISLLSFQESKHLCGISWSNHGTSGYGGSGNGRQGSLTTKMAMFNTSLINELIILSLS